MPTLHSSPHSAFTLIELLIVVALVAVLATTFAMGLRGSGASVALQAAQAELAALLNTAREQAVASGHGTRILLQVDPGSNAGDCLSRLVWQEQIATEWRTRGDIRLPRGTAMLPRDPSAFASLLATGAFWIRGDGSALRSTAFRPTGELRLALDPIGELAWSSLAFTAAGTTAGSGDLVIATCVRRAPAELAEGEAPLQFVNPEQIVGVSLSAYGLVSLVGSRQGF